MDDSIFETGWNNVNEAKLDPEQQRAEEDEKRQERLDLARHFHTTFSTPSGKTVLRWLRDHTIELASFIPGTPDSDKQGYVREGQNSLVREIERQIEVAEKGDPDTGVGKRPFQF